MSWEAIAAIIAAFIAGLSGFLAIAWQTRSGFQTLAASQQKQAELDREARQHQYDLQQRAEEARLDRERKALAASLMGELTPLWISVNETQHLRKLTIRIAEEPGDNSALDATAYLYDYKTPVYDANVHRLGIFGPSLAVDITTIWAHLVFPSNKIPKFQGAAMNLSVLRAIDDAAATWLEDATFVTRRLRHVAFGTDDPGPLYLEKQRRKKAAETETAAAAADDSREAQVAG